MIQIFAVNISPLRSKECFERYYGKSSVIRREKADKLKMHDDKARCIAAGLLLEYSYNQYINESKKELAKANSFGHIKISDAFVSTQPKSENAQPLPEIRIAENGKPYFVMQRERKALPGKAEVALPPYFNLSHSGDYVLCAIGDCEMGADIQKITSVRENVVKKYFSKKEQDLLCGLSETEREKMFASVWARKEAAAKLSGRGIGAILDETRSTEEKIQGQAVRGFGVETDDNHSGRLMLHYGYVGEEHAWAVAFCEQNILSQTEKDCDGKIQSSNQTGQKVSLVILPEGVFFK